MTEDIEDRLRRLDGELPKPRPNLSEKEKDALIKKIGGPKTTANIIKAKKDYPVARIPFIFSSLDTQAVVDVLANDMNAALDRAGNKN